MHGLPISMAISSVDILIDRSVCQRTQILTRIFFFIVISQYYWTTWFLCWPHIYYLCLSFWCELNPRPSISFTGMLSSLSKLIYSLPQLISSNIIFCFTYNLYASLTESQPALHLCSTLTLWMFSFLYIFMNQMYQLKHLWAGFMPFLIIFNH